MPTFSGVYAYVCFRLCLPFPEKGACFFASHRFIYIFYRIFVREYP